MNNETRVAHDFPGDVKDHRIEIVRDDGVHRHISIARPGSGIDRYGIVTWPGYLCFYGDRGEYVFHRLTDMFEFFRGERVNPNYWAEKVEAADTDRGVEEFSKGVFAENVRDAFDNWAAAVELDEDERSRAVERINDEVISAAEDGDESHAIRAALDFEFDEQSPFEGFTEYDHREYTYSFLWALHAIVHAIALYDAAKGKAAA